MRFHYREAIRLLIFLGVFLTPFSIGKTDISKALQSGVTASLELRGTGTNARNLPTLAQGGILTILVKIDNISANTIAYGIFLQYGVGENNTDDLTNLLVPGPGSSTINDLTCSVGSPVSNAATPTVPQNNFSANACIQATTLASLQSQYFALRFDTSARVNGEKGIRLRSGQNESPYTIRTDAVDPNDPSRSFTGRNAAIQTFVVTPAESKLKIQGPIAVSPSIPPQGSLPTLSFSIANTGRGAFPDSTAALFFSIFQSAQPNQPAVDFSLLVAQAQACDIDPNSNQVITAQCRFLSNRQLILPSFGEGLTKQIRLVFFTSVLEPGPYQIRGCLRNFTSSTAIQTTTPSTAISCDPNDTSKDQIDFFAVNFQVGSPDGVISAFVSPDSPTQTQIEQGKDATILLTVANFTGIFQRSIAFSFSLDPRASRKVPLECKEPLEPNVEFDLARGEQCVLENVSPSRSQDIGTRKMRILLPTSEFKKDQKITLTVSDGNRLLRPSAKLTFQVVEKATSGTGGTGGQQPTGPGPELHPTSLEFIPASPVTQGQTVLVRSKIENTGNRFTGPFTVNFQLYSVNTNTNTIRFVAELGETRRFPGIDPNVIIEASTLLDTCARASNGNCTLETGTYLLKVIVSAVPNELDRTNNELSTLLTIQPKK
jgi:hypothetical protein